MVRPNAQRSSSEDRRSLTSTRITRSTTPSSRLTSTTSHYHHPVAGKSANPPAIGSVRITRTEDFYQPSTTTTRSRSQTRGRTQVDSVNGSTTSYHVGSGRDSASGGVPHHDMFVVGYATVTTQQRPPGSEGVNYKVYLNQPQRSRSSLTPTPTVHASSTASRKTNYSVADDEDDVTPLHSYHRYQSTRSSVSPSSSYSSLSRGKPYQASSATLLGSSRISRSTSLPHLDRAVYGVTSSYRPVPRTVAWQPITSTADQSSFKLKSTSTTRDSLNDRELYERLRLVHLNPYGDSP
jgi:hypothetical protein